MNHDERQSDSGEHEPSRRLRADLRRLYDDDGIPAEVDQAVLAGAGRRMVGRRRRRVVLRTLTVGAAAAVVLLAVWVGPGMPGWRESPVDTTSTVAVSETFLREDLDRDGVVDIRDAFRLARHLRDGADDARWDINGDGTVDSADVDGIALVAVRLEKGAG